MTFIVEERFFMKKSYDQIRIAIDKEKKTVIHFAIPLMWYHVEYARALIARYEYLSTRDLLVELVNRVIYYPCNNILKYIFSTKQKYQNNEL